MQILIPENTHIILRVLSKFPGGKYARKFLELSENRVEASFDIHSFMDKKFNIKEKSIEKFKHRKKRGIVNTSKVFHGYAYENPLFPNLETNLAKDDIEKSIKALKSQIDIISALRNKEDIPSILVQHAGLVDREKIDSGFKKIYKILERALPYAREKNVKICFENLFNYFDDNTYHIGSNFKDLEYIMKKAEEFNLRENIGIVFDIGHALIENKGNYRIIADFIMKNKDYIDYAHIHYPVEDFKDFSLIKSTSAHLPISMIRDLNLSRVPDGHRGIVRAFQNNEFRNIIKLLVKETNIKNTGCIGLEIASRWNWFWFFYKKGATAKEIYESYKLLDSLI